MFLFSKTSIIAKIAALQFKVSKTVSTNSKSTPPSINAPTCSVYAVLSSSKLILRNAGSSTFGDIEAKLEKYGGNPDVVIAEP